MTSLDKYDKIYAKYSEAIDGRAAQCDPPTFRDPPDDHKAADPQKDVVPIKAGSNLVTYRAASPESDVTLLKGLPSDTTTSPSIHGRVLSRYQDPPELKDPVASRDDDITSSKQSDKGCSRDDNVVVRSMIRDGENVRYILDRFNAKRTSMRSIYGSPLASPTFSSGGDPPSDDLDSRLAFLTKQSLVRRSTIFPKSEAKKVITWNAATNINTPHRVPSSSPAFPMRSLAMRLISEQILDDGYRMIQDKCPDCANNMVEASKGSGMRKCIFCPINDFRAIIQGAVSNRVMAAKWIQGGLVVSDGQCEHCYSPTQEGISCEVCPILDEVCIEVARAIGRGGALSYSSRCNDCESQHVKSSNGVIQCIVCSVLNLSLGEQQLYKPGKAFASSASLKSYQDTLNETTQLLESIKLQDNTSVQIQLDEELVKAKNAQCLLGATIGNIAYESKTSGLRNELKAELLKAKEAQLVLQKMLEKKIPPNASAEQEGNTVDVSGSSYAISQREIDAGTVKEYIPPPKHFFQRGIPTTIRVEQQQRQRGVVSVGSTSYYTNNLKQSAPRQYVADCCGVRIHEQPSYDDDGTEYFDDGSIGTDDQYTVEISLNSYEPKLSVEGDASRKHYVVEHSNRDEKTAKRRSRWSIFDLCGRPPTFNASEGEEKGTDIDESYRTYHTDYRHHRRFSFDNEDKYHLARQTNIRRDDDSSHASMYSNITPGGILKYPSTYRSQSPSFSVMTDDRSRMFHRGQHQRRLPSSGNSVSSSEHRKVSFYNHHYRDLDIDKLKTLTEEGDDSFQSQHPSPAVLEVRRTIAESKALLIR